MILSTPRELDEFNEAFKGSLCHWKQHCVTGEPFQIGSNRRINALQVFGDYFKEYLISVTPTEKALKYLYKLVGEDYDDYK